MGSDPIITLVIPAFNESKMIARTFPYIKELDYDPELLELILVDNGSTDGTPEVAGTFGFRVIYAPGKTIAQMRNLGARNGKGDLIAFLDADCIACSEWFRKGVSHLADPGICAVGTVAAPPPAEATWVERNWQLLSSTAGCDRVRNVEWLSSFNLLVRRSAFEKVGGFAEDLVTCEDSDLGHKLKREGRLILDGTMKTVHLRDSKTIREFIRREYWRGKGNLKSFFRHRSSFRELPSLLLPLVYSALFFALFPIVVIARRAGWWLLPPVGLFVLGAPFLMIARKSVPLRYVVRLKGPYLLSALYLLSRGCAFFPLGKARRSS